MRLLILVIATMLIISGCEEAATDEAMTTQLQPEKAVAETVEESPAEAAEEAAEQTMKVETVKVEPAAEKAEAVAAEEVKVEATAVKAEGVAEEAVEEVKVEAVVEETEVAAAEEVAGDEVVVTVNGVEILESEVAEKVDERFQMQVQRMSASGREVPEDALKNMRERMRTGIVDMMVEEKLLKAKIAANGIEVTDDDITGRIAEMAEERGVKLEDVPAEIEKSGGTMEEFKNRLKMNLSIEKLIDKEMGAEAKMTEEEAKKFYDENTQRFSSPDQVEASHILVKTDKLDEAGKAEAKTKIEGLLEEVKGGADFAKLAEEHSDCPSGKRDGGNLGYFSKERMVPEFSAAAFAMEEGQISDVVETKFGYHIIKVTGKKAASTKSFEEAKDDIIKNQEMRKKSTFWRQFRTDLKSEAEIVWSEKEQKAREEAEKNRPKPPARPMVKPTPAPAPSPAPTEKK
jgi:peptidyl-prolyl cis-trans isomerase C